MELFKAFKEWSDQKNGQIEIFTSEGKMTAINRLKPGATQEKIEDISNFFSVSLPPDYIGFLQLCNGASLFEHPEYGGEVLLYSTGIRDAESMIQKITTSIAPQDVNHRVFCIGGGFSFFAQVIPASRRK